MSGVILVMGLPGAGKTTLSKSLAQRLSAVHFNADALRLEINKDLGFSISDRIEQARRMGWLCNAVSAGGGAVIADFVCPTPETRAAFGPAFVVWVDRIQEGRFEDTNRLFMAPMAFDIRVMVEGSAESWAEKIQSAFLASPHAPASLRPTPPFSYYLRSLLARQSARIFDVLRTSAPILLALCLAVVIFREVTDPTPFRHVSGLLQSGLLAWAFVSEGIFAAISGALLTLIFDYFVIDPHFQLGVSDWRGFALFFVSAIIATVIALVASRELSKHSLRRRELERAPR